MEMKMTYDFPRAIDVSGHNKLMSVSGNRLVMIKLTEGVGYVSSAADKWVTQCRKDGVPFGFYHYARPELNGQGQMEAEDFIDAVRHYPDTLCVALDWEGEALKVRDGDLWMGNWLEKVSILKIPRLVYMSASEARKEKYQYAANVSELWVAQWGSEPDMSHWPTWKEWAIWQYTNTPHDCDYLSESFCNEIFGYVSHETSWKISNQSKNKVTIERGDGMKVTVEC